MAKINNKKIAKIQDKCEELAELIGIILGDGCIRKEGQIIISFNKTEKHNFIEKRVVYLINNS